MTLAEAALTATIDAGVVLWESGDRAGAAECFAEALGVQRSLISGGGLVEHGPTFLRWVDWPVQALLSQDVRFAVDNRDYTAEAVAYARRLGGGVELAAALVHEGLARWNVGDRAGAAECFAEALGVQRSLISGGGLVEHGPTFLRWVDWPVQALLSQDVRFAVDNRDYTAEAVAYARRLGGGVELAAALVHEGLARWNVGDRAGAAECFAEALGVQRSLISGGGLVEHGPTFLRWVDWPVQALLSQDVRFAVDNRDYTAEAVAYARRLGGGVELAAALVHEGLARWNVDDRAGAASQFKEAVAIQHGIVESTGSVHDHGLALVRWVDWPMHALLTQEDHFSADDRDLTEMALGYARELDDAALLAQAMINAAVALWKTGDHVAAAGLFKDAMRVQRDLIAGATNPDEHRSQFVRWADWPVGAMLTQDDRFTVDNRDIAQEALDHARRLDDQAVLASALVSSGISRWRIGESSAAAKLFQEALHVQRTLMAAPGGVREHGPAFVRWVEWPIGTLMAQDERHHRFCLAIRAEAADVKRELDR